MNEVLSRVPSTYSMRVTAILAWTVGRVPHLKCFCSQSARLFSRSPEGEGTDGETTAQSMLPVGEMAGTFLVPGNSDVTPGMGTEGVGTCYFPSPFHFSSVFTNIYLQCIK